MTTNPYHENTPTEPATRAPVSPDELLPPVEPPSAGFIIQLFVIPAIIVTAIVLLWLLVTTLATRGDLDPEKIVQVLRSSNQARWQKADELANMLRLEQRYPELKRNAELAGKLAKLLDEEVDAGRDDDNSVKLRYFLCRVLGEFYVDDGLAVLLRAARDDADRDVRREAINALAVLGDSLGKQEPPISFEHPELVETLVRLANDQDDLIRSQTAFALGVLTALPQSDPRLTKELELLADDLYSDARYNAALGLARRGNLKGVEAVIEMLDPDALATSIARETEPALETYKRNTMLRNALDASALLLEKNPDANLDDLVAAVQRFVETATDWDVAGAVPDVLIERGRALLERSGNR